MNASRRLQFAVAAAAFALIFTALLPSYSRAEHEKPAGAGLAYISYLTGDVLFSGPDAEEWNAATPNYALMQGDKLWAGEDAKAEVRFESGETAWLNYQSELDFVKLDRDEEGIAYQLGLPAGEATFDVRNFDTLNSVFQVDTPNTSVRAFGRARFRVTSLSDGSTQVGVTEGSVEVESEDGVANVDAGEMLEVYPDGRSRIMALPGPDGWDDWVASRLHKRDRVARSTKYLPREMYGYADEFDDGGRWVSYPEYGNVWVPSVSVGWSPYSNGRWVWYGFDYVWLPYDPWYAPFHYGRWHWTVSFGWCWIPPLPGGFYWSPGYVGWVWSGDYVYWVPLAPGEVYYGYGHYGPHSVNIYTTNVYINKNVYINSRATNGVVVVKRGDFLSGKVRRADVKRERIREAFSRKERGFGGSPAHEFKPTREARQPRPDVKIRKEQLPPERVTERLREVRDRRLVRGDVKSAFEPGRRPVHMKELERVREPSSGGERRDRRPDVTREKRRERRPETRPDTRPERRPETRPEARPETRPERRPETRPDTRPEIRPETRPETPLGQKIERGQETVPATPGIQPPASTGIEKLKAPEGKQQKRGPDGRVKKDVKDKAEEDMSDEEKAKEESRRQRR